MFYEGTVLYMRNADYCLYRSTMLVQKDISQNLSYMHPDYIRQHGAVCPSKLEKPISSRPLLCLYGLGKPGSEDRVG